MRAAPLALALTSMVACGARTETGDGDASARPDAGDFDGGPLACSIPCAPTQTCCGGLCADLALNPEDCGQCGVVCRGGEICRDGHCVPGASCATVDAACPADDCCQGVCCPTGTRCAMNELEPWVCCPDTDNCGCGVTPCPVSTYRAKRDIRYLTPQDLRSVRDDLVSVPLARWRYRGPMDDGREHVGFVLEDAPGIAASDQQHGRVDLYGLASMSVAAIQSQQREIDDLREQVRVLEERCANRPPDDVPR